MNFPEFSQGWRNKVSKTRVTATIIFAALIPLVLAGCGGATQAGNAVAAPTTAAPVTVTKTAAPRPKPKPTPTVTATVTQAAQPPVVVVPAPAPQTVYQQPTTVYQRPETQYVEPPSYSGTAAAQQISNDYYVAESMVGSWIPQLGSSTSESEIMTRFNSLKSMSGGYSDVFMVRSSDYSSFTNSGYYVILLPRTFSTPAGLNAWLDSEGFAPSNGFAKRLSHTDGPSGNSVERD